MANTKSLAIILGVAIISGLSIFGILYEETETEPIKEITEPNKQEITPTSQKDPADFIIDTGLDSSTLATQYASQIVSNCNNNIDCTLNSLRYIDDNRGADIVLSTFTQLLDQYTTDKIKCHETVHHLGKFLYTYVENDLSKAFEYAGQTCGGSIFHGVVQNYFATQKSDGIDPDTINISDICPKFEENPYKIDRWQCLHGIGHGLAVLYDYDIFSAVKKCEVFDPGWEQISCSKGIFMQNNVEYTESGGGNFDEDDILYPCSKVDAKYAPRCYHYQTTYILTQNGGNVNESFAVCDKIEPEEFVKYCYYGMGRQLFAETGGDVSKINRYCQVGEQEQYYADCFRGMVMIFVNNDRDPSEGFLLCKNIPDHSKADCYDAMGKWFIMYYPDREQRAKVCSDIPQEYYKNCANASLDGIKLL